MDCFVPRNDVLHMDLTSASGFLSLFPVFSFSIFNFQFSIELVFHFIQVFYLNIS